MIISPGIISLLLLVGFILTSLAIPVAKKIAEKYGLVSFPREPSRRRDPIPLLGGVAIYLPFALVFTVFFTLLLLGNLALTQPTKAKMLALFLGTTWILVLGIIDDKETLGWRQKLLGQFFGGVILVLGGHTLDWVTLPLIGPVDFGWYGIPLFILAVIVVTNAINLIDGLDGLAGGICFFAALTSSVVALVKGDYFTTVIGFTISGSLLGFLMFNYPPASIFLGDGGSMMLGFLLGTLATSSAAVSPGQRLGTSFMILVPFLPLSVPLFELTLSVFRRWIKGQAIFLGDGNHLHHRLLVTIKNPRLTIAIFYLFSTALCVLTLLAIFEESLFMRWTLGSLIALLLLAGALGSIRLYQFNNLSLVLQNRPHFKFLGRFRRSMKKRVRHSQSLPELLSLLASGVQDLGFDSLEVASNGRILKKWVNPSPLHPGSPRIYSEDTLPESELIIRWVRPTHDDETYNEYLVLTWHRFLLNLKNRIATQPRESLPVNLAEPV
ncbi:MAG: MraY family glycosyltransferase [Thermodesulfobacteriota bacterium]